MKAARAAARAASACARLVAASSRTAPPAASQHQRARATRSTPGARRRAACAARAARRRRVNVERRPVAVDRDVATAARRATTSTIGDGATLARMRCEQRRESSASRSPITAGAPGLKIPAFSRAISSRVVAEVLDVVDADRRHAGDQRPHDVRRVEPAAEPRLDDRDVDVRAREEVEGHRRRRLEERRAEALDRRRPALDEVDDVRPRRPRSPSTTMRSRKSTRCGDVYLPTRSPCARSSASSVAQTLPFPFVPATWNDAQALVRVAERARAAPPSARARTCVSPVVRANR